MLRIDRLHLATLTRVPAWHPLHDGFRPVPVHAWLVHHPDGPVLFDTGVGSGHASIEEWYAPSAVTSVRGAVQGAGVDPDAIAAVVLSHLHFDHCGGLASLAAPVYVQRAEVEAARAPGYTVPEWATIEGHRLRAVDGDHELADGLRLLATPGHTPGHQSLLVDVVGERVVLGGQCAYFVHELATGEPAPGNLHDPSWHDAARRSLARVRDVRPATVHLSHDPVAWGFGGWEGPEAG